MSWYLDPRDSPAADIHRAIDRGAGASAERHANDALDRVRQVEGELARLHLVCRAMWELVRERSDLTDDELIARIREVDLSDGKLDGKVRVEVVDCVACGRVVGRRHDRCIYCGAPRMMSGPF